MSLSDKKNRGEWSEFYALLHILATGKIRSSTRNDDEAFDFQVLSVSLIIDGIDHTFQIKDSNIEVLDISSHTVIELLPQSQLLDQSKLLLSKIKTEKGRSFPIPEMSPTMSILRMDKVAGSNEKTDLFLNIYDPRIKRETKQGFSIKSFMGGKPTLLNAAGTTNIEYTIAGEISEADIAELNKLGPIEIVTSLYEQGCQLTAPRMDNRFVENLRMIDSEMDFLLAHIVLASFQGKGRGMNEILKILISTNPLDYPLSNCEIRYVHKIKDLIEAVALGMRPSKPWAGIAEAKGGHLIVTSTGEVICHHALDKDTLRSYLFDNLTIDTPSQKRHKFGKIVDGKLNLNFQIRFK
jgi:hypothetical protein